MPEYLTQQQQFLAEVKQGSCLRKGSLSGGNDSGALALSITEANTIIGVDQEVVNCCGIFDFTIYNLREIGQSEHIVIPQRIPLPANGIYRIGSIDRGWNDFISDVNNQIYSSPGLKGYCPPPGDDAWQPGLIEGSWCVQVLIEDGGLNDTDRTANRTISDPSGVGVYMTSNRLPLPLYDSVEIWSNSEIIIDVLANDYDPDNDTLSISSAYVNFGEVEITNEQITYIPKSQYIGNDLITYSVSYGQGGSAIAEGAITISVNHSPIANDDSATTDDRTAIVIDVLANDSDVDGDQLVVTSAVADRGKVTIRQDYKLIFVPELHYRGQVMIGYNVSDGINPPVEGLVLIMIPPLKPS